MFYKHWKKIALALTGFFWNSCDNGPTAVENGGTTPSSSSNSNNESSSSAVVPASSSTPLYGVMSSAVQLSSSSTESSSSFERIMPAYGVYDQVACYEDGNGVKTNDEISITKLICDDGVVCKETEVIKSYGSEPCSEGFNGVTICPDYGIVTITERTYNCNGIKFNEAEFRTRYDHKYTTKPQSSSSMEQSSSSAAQSSSSYNICMPEAFFCEDRSEKYTESQAKSSATEQAKWDGYKKIGEIIREQFKDKDVPKCLQDMNDSLDKGFVALYGVMGCTTPSRYRCTDGTTYFSEKYLEQQEFDKEQAKKKPQYDEKYNEFYKEETEKFDKAINECLNSEESKE